MAIQVIGSKLPTFPSDQEPSTKGLGQNGYGGASSSTSVANAPSASLKVGGNDAVMDVIRARGTGRATTASVGNQVRDVGRSNLPATFGHHSPNRADEKVLSRLSPNPYADEQARRAAALGRIVEK